MLQLRFIDRVKFLVERQFVKGAAWQVLMVMLLIGLISVVGGLLVLPVAEEVGVGEAVWWAFLRLTDPGYLGDDRGTWQRIVSTLLTVAGYVVFLGTLVAIMTRKLIAIMADLERGLTPVSLKRHVVVLGWNSRTVPILRDLLNESDRMRRFLERNDARSLRLVVLSEQASAQQRLELTGTAGIGRRSRQVVLRSGSPIQPDALQRVACLDAAAVILPSRAHGHEGLVTSDVETVKALLSIAAQARLRGVPLPLAVVELQDQRKRAVVERAYPAAVEIVAGDTMISRLLVQNFLHPGLAALYHELLTSNDGNELYVRSGESMGRTTLELLATRCPHAIVLGLLRPTPAGWDVQLLAATSTVVQPDDGVVMLARSYADTEPLANLSRRRPTALPPVARIPARAVAAAPVQLRILVLGWSRRVPALLAEFASHRNHRFTVDLVSVVPVPLREREIGHFVGELPPMVQWRQIEADYMVESELRRLAPEDYDAILLLSNHRLASGEEADARTLLGHLQLDDILSGAGRRPHVIMELSDPANQLLLDLPATEVLVSPLVVSHMLAQVALRRELRAVFDELFGAVGPGVALRPAAAYALPARADFHTLELAAADRGEIALGIYRCVGHVMVDGRGNAGTRLLLNPPRDQPLQLAAGDQIVVLAGAA